MSKRARVGMSLVATSLMLLLGHTAFAGPVTPSVFAPFLGPIGVAASKHALYVTRGCVGTSVEVHALGSAGEDTLLATIPSSVGVCEGYIAISPGLGGFVAHDLYVTAGQQIWRVTPSGASVTLFATLPVPIVTTHTGITFDQVGTFNDRMIATTSEGHVFTIDHLGVVRLVVAIPALLESPAVAPLTFGPFGGQVFVVDEITGAIRAISATGVVTTVAHVVMAEHLDVVPRHPCEFGTTEGVWFAAIFPTAVDMLTVEAFEGLKGQMIVTSEGGGSAVLSWDKKTGYTVHAFGASVGQHEGSAFVACEIPQHDCDKCDEHHGDDDGHDEHHGHE